MKYSLILLSLLILSAHASDLLKSLSQFADANQPASGNQYSTKFAKSAKSPFSESESESEDEVEAPPPPPKKKLQPPPPSNDDDSEGEELDVMAQLKSYQQRLSTSPKDSAESTPPPRKQASPPSKPEQKKTEDASSQFVYSPPPQEEKHIDNFEAQKQAQLEKYAKKFHLDEPKQKSKDDDEEDLTQYMPKINFQPLPINTQKLLNQKQVQSEESESSEPEELQQKPQQVKQKVQESFEGLELFKQRFENEPAPQKQTSKQRGAQARVEEQSEESEAEVEPAPKPFQKKGKKLLEEDVSDAQPAKQRPAQESKDEDLKQKKKKLLEAADQDVEKLPSFLKQKKKQPSYEEPDDDSIINQSAASSQAQKPSKKQRQEHAVEDDVSESEAPVSKLNKTDRLKKLLKSESEEEEQEEDVPVSKIKKLQVVKHEHEQLQQQQQQTQQVVEPQGSSKKRNKQGVEETQPQQQQSFAQTSFVEQKVFKLQAVKKQQQMMELSEEENEEDNSAQTPIKIPCGSASKLTASLCKMCSAHAVYKITNQNWMNLDQDDGFRYLQSFQPLMEFTFKSIGDAGDYYMSFKGHSVCVAGDNLQKQINLDKVLKHFTGNSLEEYNSPLNLSGKRQASNFILHAEHDSLLNGFSCRRFQIGIKTDQNYQFGKKASMNVKQVIFYKNQLKVKYLGLIIIHGQTHQASLEQIDGGEVSNLIVSQINSEKEMSFIQTLASNYLDSSYVQQMIGDEESMIADLQIQTHKSNRGIGLSFNLKRRQS